MLRIPRALYDELLAHCQRAYPKEACGILTGRRDAAAGAEDVIVQVYPMTNVEDSPVGYAMEPKEQLHTEQLMRQRGQRMAGIYHSHTATDAYPSPVDVSLAISPDVSYVLVSLQHRARPELKSYRIDGPRVVPEPWGFAEEPGAGGTTRSRGDSAHGAIAPPRTGQV
jgi:proteasome lid subunit RPN8/RPN11